MTTRTKLTNQDLTTHNGFKWTVGEWKETSGVGELCGPGWLHCYRTSLLAVLHNPIHAHFSYPLGWTVDVDGFCKEDGALKEGWTRMRLVERVELPTVTMTQRIAYAILCAMEGVKSRPWLGWANRWLSGEDRSRASAEAAMRAADTAREGAAWVASDSKWAAAAWAAWAAAEAEATRATAAEAVEQSEEWASRNGRHLDLIALSEKAMAYK